MPDTSFLSNSLELSRTHLFGRLYTQPVNLLNPFAVFGMSQPKTFWLPTSQKITFSKTGRDIHECYGLLSEKSILETLLSPKVLGRVIPKTPNGFNKLTQRQKSIRLS